MDRIKALSIITAYKEQPEVFEKYGCSLSDINNDYKNLKERLVENEDTLSDEELVILSALFIRDAKAITKEKLLLQKECSKILATIIEVN